MLGYSNLRKMRLPNVDVGNSVVAELMTMNCLLQQMQVHMTEQVQQTQHMVAREEELSVKQEQSHEALHMMMQQLSQQVMQQQQQHQQMMFQQQQSQQQQQTRQVQHQLLAQQHQQQQKQQQLLLEQHYESLQQLRSRTTKTKTNSRLNGHLKTDKNSSDDDEAPPGTPPQSGTPPHSSQETEPYKPSFLHSAAQRMAALACEDQFPASALSSVVSEWEDATEVDFEENDEKKPVK